MNPARILILAAALLLSNGCDALVEEDSARSEPGITRIPIEITATVDSRQEHFASAASGDAVQSPLPSNEAVDAGPVPGPCDEVQGVWLGSFALESESDLEALAGYAVVAGDLHVNIEAFSVIELECLSAITGTLVAEPEIPCVPEGTLERITLPRLTALGGARVQFNKELTTVAMPQLVSVDEDMVFENNPELTVFSYANLETVGGSLKLIWGPELAAYETPVLETVGGTLEIAAGFGITEIHLPALVEAGGLRISGNKIQTVFSAPELRSVEGMFKVSENSEMTTIHVPHLGSAGGVHIKKVPISELRLDVLHTVGDLGFEIWANDSIDALSLPVLTSIAGKFVVSNHENLTTIGAPVLKTVGLELWVSAGPALTSVSLPEVTEVGHTLGVGGNDILTSFALPALETVGYHLKVKSNEALVHVDLPKLDTVRDVIVMSNPALPFFDLPALEAMTGELSIRHNDDLHTVHMSELTSARSLVVESNPALHTLELVELVTLSSDLHVEDNTVLTVLALPNLSTITGWGRFKLIGNPMLTHFAMPSLSAVDRSMEIEENDALTFFCMPQLTAIGTEDSGTFLQITGNDSLTSFVMSSLATAPRITIKDNAALTELDLPELKALDNEYYNLRVLENPVLASVEFPSLVSILGDLEVSMNAELQTLSLGKLEEVGGTLLISENPNLPQCAIDFMIDTLDGGEGLGDEVESDDNDPSCSCAVVNGKLAVSCQDTEGP